MSFSLRRLFGLDHNVPRTPAKRPHRTRLRLERLEERDVPAPLVVTTLADAGAGSLRAAITAADAAGGNQQINFQAGLSGAITLKSVLPDLSANITIAGTGNVSVYRDSLAAHFRIFTVDANTTCAISGLAANAGVSDGNGGGVDNMGTLTLTNMNFYNDQATGTNSGGAIANEQNATLTATGCTLSEDLAGARGGAVYNAGSATFSGASTYGNSANIGGGFDNATGGTLLINNNSFVNSNTASQEGGGVANFGQFTMNGGEIYSNTCTSGTGYGGGVCSDGPADGTGKVTLSGVDIEENRANKGGGLYVVGKLTPTTANLTDCTISNNTAPLGNGIAYQTGATYTLTNCTVTDQIVQDS